MTPKETREAFRRASGEGYPSLDRLLGAVPAIQAEARRARASATEANGASRLLPKLALATAAIALLAVVALYRERSGVATPPAPLDSWILSGAGSDQDVLFEAVLASDRNDG